MTLHRWVWLDEPDEAGVRRVVAYLLCEGEPTPEQCAKRLYGAPEDGGEWGATADQVEPWTLVPPEAGLVGDDWRLLPDGRWAPPEWAA